MKPTVAQNVSSIRAQLDAVGQERVEICAVTKTIAPDLINQLVDTEIKVIGENKVQEYLQKHDLLNNKFSSHIIGQLQSNKVKYIVDNINMIQSLDRLELAKEIDKRAQAKDKRIAVLIQVNIAKEKQKAGLNMDELLPFVATCVKMDGLYIQGLMAIMPQVTNPEMIRHYFSGMRKLYDELRDRAIEGTDIKWLSMGMSGDYLVAAQEGANMVRVGSAIFGQRAI